jgi:hypothetical protein
LAVVDRKSFRQLDDSLPIFFALYFYKSPYQFQTLEGRDHAGPISSEQFV